ncbi:putative bifunctional diguanylate cyclase/phosphodiesterase [Alloiococcus sp. CFN-8]|uniref:putative bifunctional diguanylate cyclase/phosphodiesterase n=1 Tax=Alloiococcus sp. CFN-8 TaxID=3416081 RepID=UPI003CEE3273
MVKFLHNRNPKKKNVKATTLTTFYIIFSMLWFLISNHLMGENSLYGNSQLLIKYFNTASFTLVTALTFYTAISKMENYLHLSINRLKLSNENLRSAKERLHIQLEEINMKEEALRTSEERYRLASDGSKDGIWDLDLIGEELYISRIFTELLGIKKVDPKSNFKCWYLFIHKEERAFVRETLNNYLEGKIETLSVECRVRKNPNEYIWILLRGKGIWNETGIPVRIAGSITDITERKLSEQKIYNLAYYDNITGLPSRTYLIESLHTLTEESFKKDRNFVVFFIDLDNFKQVNDTLGHDLGDLMMKNLAKHLQEVFDKSLCSRFGGDEFIVIREFNSETDNISEISKNIVKSFNKPWVINNHEFYMSVSIGVSIFPIHGTEPTDLIKNADLAMYTAKSLGKNTYAIYNPMMRSNLLDSLHWEKDIIKGMEQDEFIVYYQPQISVDNEACIGAEALVRWKHKEKGFIPPNEFIPTAEESGLIIKLGEIIIEKALKQLRYWSDNFINVVPISINLSPLQFQQQNFIQFIDQTLHKYNISPSMISFEITESTALKDINQTIETIRILDKMGIKVALDDFGTGYSSLTYLKQLPISHLKIDKSFIKDIHVDVREASIVLSIITLAHDLSIKVIAEGVENIEQYVILKDFACDEIQGFYFGRPMDPEGFVKYIMEDNTSRGRVMEQKL